MKNLFILFLFLSSVNLSGAELQSGDRVIITATPLGEVESIESTNEVSDLDDKPSTSGSLNTTLSNDPQLTLTNTSDGFQNIQIQDGPSEFTQTEIDGFNLRDPMAPSLQTNLNTVPNLDYSMDIYKGPQSGSANSGSMTGVLSLTSLPVDKFGINMFHEIGSYSYANSSLMVQDKKNEFAYRFRLNRLDDSGQSMKEFSLNEEDDAYEYYAGSAQLEYDKLGFWKLLLSHNRSQSDLDDEDFFGNSVDDVNYWTKHKNNFIQGSWKNSYSSFLNPSIRAGYSDTLREYQDLDDGAGDTIESQSSFDSSAIESEVNNKIKLKQNNDVILGYKYRRESGKFSYEYPSSTFEPTIFTNKNSNTHKIYSSTNLKFFEYLGLNAGVNYKVYDQISNYDVSYLRYSNDFNSFNENLTGLNNNLNYDAKFSLLENPIGFTSFLSYTTSSRQASLFQRFSSFGNEGLKIQRSEGLSFGIKQEIFNERIILSASTYHNRFYELIDYDPISEQFENIGRATTQGTSAKLELNPINNLFLQTSYLRSNSKDNSTGLPLLRRPKYTNTNSISFKKNKKFLTSLSYRREGKRDDFDFLTKSRVSLDALNIVETNNYIYFLKNWKIGLRISNLLNEKKQKIIGYKRDTTKLFTKLSYEI